MNPSVAIALVSPRYYITEYGGDIRLLKSTKLCSVVGRRGALSCPKFIFAVHETTAEVTKTPADTVVSCTATG